MRRAPLLAAFACLAGIAALAQEKPADTQESPAGKREKPAGPGPTGGLTEEEFKALHDLTDKEPPAPRGKMVDLDGARAYLSLPKGEPPFPAVIVIHEWWGLTGHIQHWADRLAADGFAALAVDLYGGKVADNRDDAMRYMKGVDAANAQATLKRAHAFLKEDARVKAARRGCMGWCFGGAWTLKHAMATPDLDAAIMYYGQPVLDPAELKAIRAPLLGIFGNRDKSIPPEKVDAFGKALAEAGVKHRILSYDADHAFANPSGGRYDETAAAAAWAEARAFLSERLR
ncbi:MAG: dienelactone hydrolase family protein [Planctomycetes bacterium]|nr:dienelactone hydrolase family protein [Planctomycetota bacterium]